MTDTPTPAPEEARIAEIVAWLTLFADQWTVDDVIISIKLREAASALTASRSRETFKCNAIHSLLSEPRDCNWPVCGCDPYASKVIEALEESGALGRKSAIRAQSMEEAAGIAKAHKGRAAQERRNKSKANIYRFASDEAKAEIQAEERGEDIAAGEIERAIRARAKEQGHG